MTYSREYDALKDEMQQALGRDGTEAFFIKKSLLMKSLWQPKPLLKELLRILWTALTDGSGGYVAVHIRRYDKLWVEASAIPISVFADKIKGLCESAVSRCPKSIFVMYDDEAAFLELERLLGSTFQVRPYIFYQKMAEAAVSTKNIKRNNIKKIYNIMK